MLSQLLVVFDIFVLFACLSCWFVCVIVRLWSIVCFFILLCVCVCLFVCLSVYLPCIVFVFVGWLVGVIL